MNNDLSTELDKRVLGQTPGHIHLHTCTDHYLVSTRLARQAHHSLHIFSYDLDAPVYGQASFIEAAKQFAITNRNALIKILLQDNGCVQRKGHRLIDLGRKIPSRIELRRPHPDYIDHPENFLIADGLGYIRRDLYTRYDGIVDFHAPLNTQKLEGFFSEVWERSEPESDLRRLSL